MSAHEQCSSNFFCALKQAFLIFYVGEYQKISSFAEANGIAPRGLQFLWLNNVPS